MNHNSITRRTPKAHPARTHAIFAAALVLAVCALVYQSSNRVVTTPGNEVVTPPGATVSSARATTGDTVRMTAALERGMMLRGQAPEGMHLMIDLEAAANKVRPPLEIAIVMDQSSSMAGAKLDDAKRAARSLIDGLKAGDRVALIRYDTFVHTDVPMTDVKTGRQRLLNALDRMEATGATNISGGLEAGLTALQTRAGFETPRVRHLILLSDGRATAGLRDSTKLAALARDLKKQGITITTMGLGLDYSELSMTRIAKHGGGHYRHISESTNLGRAFTRELESVAATVAIDTHVLLNLEPGVRLLDPDALGATVEGQAVRIPIHSLSSGERRSMLVSLAFDASYHGSGRVTTAEVLYHDVGADRLSSHRLRLQMGLTSSADEVRSSADREVLIRQEQLRAASTYESAMDHFEKGQRADALRLLEQRASALEKAGLAWKAPTLRKEASKAQDITRELRALEADSPSGRAAIKQTRYRSYQITR